MKAIMVMFDSLNRRMLPPYGCDWVHAPNFKRLAEKTVTFDNSFVGSMPCMPARRELHTGRLNFLHRSWGSLEPFDDSMPEILKKNGIHTHLVSDHHHYWEEGGANYHTKYSTFEFLRGQEADRWKEDLDEPSIPNPNPDKELLWSRNDWINRFYMQDESEYPQARTFKKGIEFLEKNHSHDNWFLQIETFDPHEPFYVPQKYKDLYDYDYSKFQNDWPNYSRVGKEKALSMHYRFLQAALISMCDHYLGQLLDKMDSCNLWEDTMLIVNTDHGFLLGEHDWWAKIKMPFYNEIAHTPLFIFDPRTKIHDKRRKSLVQNIDWAPTILDYFGFQPTPDMDGKPLNQVIKDDTPVRKACLFGVHGGHINVTDGRYVYMKAPIKENSEPLYEYTHMPVHMNKPFCIDEMKSLEIANPFSFTKGCKVMKTKGRTFQGINLHQFGDLLFDNEKDYQQKTPLHDPEIEKVMKQHMVRLMKENDAPTEQFERVGLLDN